jgi:hypothetical protein
MAKKYNIAKSSNLDGLNIILSKSEVSEESFWELIKNKVTEMTVDSPDKFDEGFETIKSHLSKGSSLTINDTYFEIKGVS